MTRRRKRLVLGGALLTVAVAAAVLVIGVSLPRGMKLLEMEVYQEEQLVLRTMFDAPDHEGPGELWDHAASEPFAGEETTPIAARADDPLRATLTGPLQIEIVHVDRVLTSASLSHLELVRRGPESERWYLPAAEVTRVRHAAGF